VHLQRERKRIFRSQPILSPLALHQRDVAIQIFELSHPLDLRNSGFNKIPKFLVFTSPRQPQNRSKVQSVSHPILPDHRNNKETEELMGIGSITTVPSEDKQTYDEGRTATTRD
jgi:hypothetical protein